MPNGFRQFFMDSFLWIEINSYFMNAMKPFTKQRDIFNFSIVF